jgi:thiol-disulfide isomerase/thioredoxin
MACLRWKMTAADPVPGIRGRRRSLWPRLAALLLLSIAGIASSAKSEYGHQPLTTVADPVPAPELRLPDLTGDLVELDGLEGRVVLVNFWATWCPPCRREMPALQRLSERLGTEAFRVLGVNVREGPERIANFLQSLPVPPGFPILLDRSGETSRAWGVRVVPTTWVIDRGTNRVLGAVGEVDFDSPELVEQLWVLIAADG